VRVIYFILVCSEYVYINKSKLKGDSTLLKKYDNKIKVMALGGLNEIGKNMTVIEYKDEIMVIDCGFSFPEEDMLGIDIVIPDISYLLRNIEKVKGIFLTHGHEDHIGALPYVLKKLNVPVYGSKLTIGLIQVKLKEHKLNNANLNVVSPKDIISLVNMKVEFLRATHSIPDAFSLAVHTDQGIIFHTGDFKIDLTPIGGENMDFHRICELSKEGILLLLADSTNAERPGSTMSESTVGATFDEMFRKARSSRIIVATFSSNVHRVQQVVNSAQKFNRKVAISGRSMINVVNVGMELGYLNVPDNILIDLNDAHKYDDSELVIVTTGSQGEPMAALSRMAAGEHRKIQIKQGDLIILSSSPVPGNEKPVSKVINSLFERGAEVVYEDMADIHVSGHACQEELKLMHRLTNPKFFVPVHGEYRHLKKHAELAEELGMPSQNIFIIKAGDIFELNKNSAKISGQIPTGKILIDGLGVGDVGNIVLRDRKHLSEDGLITVVVTLSREDRKILSGPDIVSRGFVYVRESEVLISEAKNIVTNVLNDCQSRNIKEWAYIKNSIKDNLRDYLYQKTKRNPMILPIIMEV
jgi:ribonuclease J